MRVKVEAYAGYAANERPLSFTLGERTLVVKDVLDRWYGEAERYFKVSCEDGDVYVLKYLERADEWHLASFTRKDSQGTSPRHNTPKTVH